MEIKVGVISEDNQEPLQSVYEWLTDDPDIRSTASIKLVDSRPQPGSMAGEIELISLLVSSGFNMASLAVAIASWRSTRSAPPPMRIEGPGMRVIVNDSDSEATAIQKIKGALSARQEEAEGKQS